MFAGFAVFSLFVTFFVGSFFSLFGLAVVVQIRSHSMLWPHSFSQSIYFVHWSRKNLTRCYSIMGNTIATYPNRNISNNSTNNSHYTTFHVFLFISHSLWLYDCSLSAALCILLIKLQQNKNVWFVRFVRFSSIRKNIFNNFACFVYFLFFLLILFVISCFIFNFCFALIWTFSMVVGSHSCKYERNDR